MEETRGWYEIRIKGSRILVIEDNEMLRLHLRATA